MAAAQFETGDYVKVEVTLGNDESDKKNFVSGIVTGLHEGGGYNIHIPGWNKSHNKHIYNVNDNAHNVPEGHCSVATVPETLTVNSTGGQSARINGSFTRRAENHGDRPCWTKTCDDGVVVALALSVFKGKNTWIITREANLNQDGGYAICAWDMWLPTESVPDNECWGIWDRDIGGWGQDKTLKIVV